MLLPLKNPIPKLDAILLTSSLVPNETFSRNARVLSVDAVASAFFGHMAGVVQCHNKRSFRR